MISQASRRMLSAIVASTGGPGTWTDMVAGHKSTGRHRVRRRRGDHHRAQQRIRPEVRGTLLADIPTESLGCSAMEVEWRKHDFEGSRLGYLLNGAGFFHQAHRAVDDCMRCLRSWPANFRRPARQRAGACRLARAGSQKDGAGLGRAFALRPRRRSQAARLSLERRKRRQAAVMVR
jgi:hypothetical protein